MNILVTGSNGQLGSEIKDLAANYANFSFFFMDLPRLTLDRVRSYFHQTHSL